MTNCVLLAFAIWHLSFHRANSLPINNSLLLRVQNSDPIVLGTELICSGATADMMFIVDGSTSIGDENFNLVRAFLARVVSKLPEDSRVATIQFSGTPRTEFSFNAFDSTKEAEAILKQLPYKRGTTKVGFAIRHAIEKELLVERGDRPEVINIIIIITDGRSEDNPDLAAKQLRDNGNTVLVVGVTDLIDRDQLQSIAGAPQNVFEVADFTKLDSDLEAQILTNQQCFEREITEIPSGDPSLEIKCGSDSFYVAADTQNPFDGEVYAKNHYEDPNCVKRFDGSDRIADIEIKFTDCGTTRRRSLSPPGVFIENTVVFKFHPQMITKIDQTYRVQCFFMESDKTVNNDLGPVQELTTGLQTGQFEMPTCDYSVRRGSPDGEPVQFAVVGDKVFHRWQCEDEDSQGLFKITVYDCFVDDGQGNKLQVIDNEGCTTDIYLLGNLEYDENRLLVTKEAHVFKFADKPQVFFQCQINLCVNLPDYEGELACQNTPPNCTESAVSPLSAPTSRNIQPNLASNRNRNQNRRNQNSRSGSNNNARRNNNRNNNNNNGRRGKRDTESEFVREGPSLDVMTEQITVLDKLNDGHFIEFQDRWTRDQKRKEARRKWMNSQMTPDCMPMAQVYLLMTLLSSVTLFSLCLFIIQRFMNPPSNTQFTRE